MARIALIGENSIEYVDKLLSIWNSGNCAVLLDWRIPFETAYRMMLEAHVETCYIESSLLLNETVETYSDISFITFRIADRQPHLLPDNIRIKYCENKSGEEAVVLYSSGTTGASKLTAELCLYAMEKSSGTKPMKESRYTKNITEITVESIAV